MSQSLSEGSPAPLGVTPDARGVNVAVFSAHATAVEFCLFNEADREVARIRLPERTGNVFHGHIAAVAPGARYGLRAHGPFAPEEGHRFNAAKLLLDPYARLLDRPFRLHPSMFPYPPGGDDLGFDATDSAPFMPKAIVAAPVGAASQRPLTSWSDTILYELHVKGFTMRHPEVPPEVQGTFAGLAHPAATEHLVRLGVTSVEILPAAAWIEERHLAALGLANYWGYNPVALMAPEPRLAPVGWEEIRRTVAALAEAGIETIVDIVLNHSGEGDALGPTLSLRGLDNATYYRLRPDDRRFYIDDSGCGNTIALNRAPVVRLAMDALRTWAREGGVHGFRFDLATAMGRQAAGFDPESPLLTAIQQDPELSRLKLIAEPWDIGPGGYQAGNFPAGWGEWNDRFRDDVRRFWRGDPQHLGRLATRLAGSTDLFGRNRPISRSVNFVTAHDGFTLADLVSHAAKRNEANGECNRDGCDENWSWNNGCEGTSDDPAVLAARARDQRALLATLLFARGTPMLSMGAELGHSQDGNNNSYAQDNGTSWLDWAGADKNLEGFAARAAALRREIPLLRGERPLEESDAAWLSPEGTSMAPGDWESPHGGSLQMVLGSGGERVALLVHRGLEPRRFALPPSRGEWRVLLDSSGDPPAVEGGAVQAPARSVLLLREDAAAAPSAADEAVERLAEAAGIEPDWWTVDGVRHEVSIETKRHLLAAMGLQAASRGEASDALARLAEQRDLRPVPAALVAREGGGIEIAIAVEPGLSRPVRLLVERDGTEVATALVRREQCPVRPAAAADGRSYEQWHVPLPPLPAGRYRVVPHDRPELAGRLTVAPLRAWLPESIRAGRKLWGVGAQLYSLRRARDQGIGDFTTLAELVRRSAAAGAAAVGINPLHALFPHARERASPYQPSDRRFLDPIYLDVPGVDTAGPSDTDLIDYPAVWRLKEAALRERFAVEGAALTDDTPLRTFAIFCAISRRFAGARWQDWPPELRAPGSAAVAAFAEENAEEVRFHAFLQQLCGAQLAAAADAAAGMEIGLYRDLAVGAAPDGAEAWATQHLLAKGVSIGAPPDPLGPEGQVWGVPPPDPHALAADGHDSFAALLRANMAHAGALRIDHAMALRRLFWVPDGAEGKDGAYVSYPFEKLAGEIALASREARCMVVGEDLGTVPHGFREAMAERDMLGYRVMLLERDGRGFLPPEHYPRLSLACLTSHDLPTFAGWWRGADIAERETLGLISPGEAEAAREERAEERAPFEDGPDPPFAAAHARLGSAGSCLVLAQADDLAGEEIAVNVPGTDTERPNWRRKVKEPVETLLGRGGEALEALRESRGAG